MAATTTTASACSASDTLCDADVVRYWSILADGPAEAAWVTAGSEGVSLELSQASVASLVGDDQLHTAASMRHLTSAPIDDATFFAALNGEAAQLPVPLSGQPDRLRCAALHNQHRGETVTAMLPNLTQLGRSYALYNPGVAAEALDVLAKEYGYPISATENPALPTASLAKVAVAHHENLSLQRARRCSVLKHPNAERQWVLDALKSNDTRVREAAIRWPGFTEGELRAYATGDATSDPIVSVAAELVADRYTAPEQRLVERSTPHPLIADLAVWLRCLDNDETVAAASRIARAGFRGTFAELRDVATTFSH